MLRKATSNDIEFIHGLYMDPQINPWLLYPEMSMEEFEPIYKELLDKQVKYVYEHEREEMGMCKIIPLTYRTSHIVYLGGVGIHPGFAGKGHGAKMLREIIDYCRTAGYKRIELSVSVENEKAIQLYKKVGFEKEGVLRNYSYLEKEDRYVSEEMMSVLL